MQPEAMVQNDIWKSGGASVAYSIRRIFFASERIGVLPRTRRNRRVRFTKTIRQL